MNDSEITSITKNGILEPERSPDNPMELFSKWYAEAVQADINLPEHMVLSTVDGDARVSSRVVLLKDYGDEGFVFYTNYGSRKGMQLSSNPNCSLVIFWAQLDRQVRVEGRAERVSESTSDYYFASRDRLSQLGAWASKQSAPITSRSLLARNLQHTVKQYEGNEVPRPPSWGGFLVRPDMLEFWLGQPGRLHERLRYQVRGRIWHKDILSP